MRPNLETVQASPEPEPVKKLSFTPAATSTTKGLKVKANASLTPLKDTAAPMVRVTSTRRSRIESVADEEAPQAAEPKSARSSKKSAKKHITEDYAKTEAVSGEVTFAPETVSKKVKSKSSKKSSKRAVAEESHAATPPEDKSAAEEKASAKQSAKRMVKKAGAAMRKAEAPAKKGEAPRKTIGKKKKRRMEYSGGFISSALAMRPSDLEDSSPGGPIRPDASHGEPQKGHFGVESEQQKWALQVHRCRFAGWMPDPIHCLAGLPAHLGGCRIAVARSGGDIEVGPHVNGRDYLLRGFIAPARSYRHSHGIT